MRTPPSEKGSGAGPARRRLPLGSRRRPAGSGEGIAPAAAAAFPVLFAALLSCALGCRPDAPRPQRNFEHPPARPVWPLDPATGEVRQVAKYPDVLASHPELFPLADFPGGVLPDADIDPIGVARVDAAEADRLVREHGFVIVDVRKPRDLVRTGVIPGSITLQYRFEGWPAPPDGALTEAVCRELLAEAAGLVFVCNGPKCPRSFNAAVAAVQRWGVPAGRVRWFRDGTPSWTLCPLVPPEPSEAP